MADPTPQQLRRKLRRRGRQSGEWITLWAAFGLLIALAVGIWMLSAGHFDSLMGIKKARYFDLPPLPAMVGEGYQPLSREQAIAANAALAVSTAPIERALPFVLPAGTRAGPLGYNALDCLTAAVYYEAANEPDMGQRAVAQVVLNRMRHPAFPKSVCGVVFQGSERKTGCQFSFTCDGSLARRPSVGGWVRARRAAAMALGGYVEVSVGTATHYHADYVMPYWAPTLDKITTIGAHIFYRWKGYWGKRAAFTGRYSGVEQAPAGPVAGAGPDIGVIASGLPGSAATQGEQGAVGMPALINPVEQDRNKAVLNAPNAAPPLTADQGKSGLHADDNTGILAPVQR